MNFSLTPEQEQKLSNWLVEQEKLACETQRKSIIEELKELPDCPWLNQRLTELDKYHMPYYGAIGGALTYSFTPNSIGMVIEVTHGFTKNKIDLSDYDSW